MKDTSPPKDTSAAGDEAAAATEADRVAREAHRRRRWIIALTAAAAVAVMAGVMVLAKAGAGTQAKDGGASPQTLPYHLPEQHPVGPPSDPLPEGCEVDYDHPPKMSIELPAAGLDFGSIKQGVRAEKDVVVRNTGTGTLCLRRPVTGCGCVKAMLVDDQRKVAPGGTATIHVALDSTGREGEVKKTLTVSSNDPDNPAQAVTVRAQVSLGLIVSAMRVDFGNAGRGQAVSATVRLKSPKADPAWTVIAVEAIPKPNTEGPVYTFETKDVEDPTWRIVDLSIRHPGYPTYGPFQESLRLRTSHPDRAEIVLPGFIQVVLPVMAQPAMASLGFVPRNAGRTRIRLVPAQADLRFHVTGAKVQTVDGSDPGPAGPGFTVDYAPAEGGAHQPGEWWVDIRYDGKSRKPGPIRAEAIVTTDVPEAAEIKIPINATVK